MPADKDRGLVPALIGDGRSLLSLMAVALLLSGLFAIFLSFRREFLPHDVSYLGMSADELCRVAGISQRMSQRLPPDTAMKLTVAWL